MMDSRIKPLEWNGPDVNGDIHARSILCVYKIRKKQGSLGYWLTEVGGYHRTIEEAKAAAQADYERRILSALATQPAPVDGGVTDEMVSAALRCWPKNGVPYVAEDVMRSALKAALTAGRAAVAQDETP